MWNCRIHREQAGLSNSYKGLQRLEYRGMIVRVCIDNDNDNLNLYKSKGKVADLIHLPKE